MRQQIIWWTGASGLLAGAVYIVEHGESPLLGNEHLQRLALLVMIYVSALVYRRLALVLRPLLRHLWYQSQIRQGKLTPLQANYRRVLRLDDDM